MRILYSHRIQSNDGMGVHVRAMVAAFERAGHDVRVVGPGLFQSAQVGAGSGLVDRLRRVLPQFLVELLELAYGVPATFRLWRAARAFRPDVIYERYNLFFLAGAVVSRLVGVRLLVEVNSPLADERAAHGGLALRWLARWTERTAWRAGHAVLPVTQVLARRVADAEVPGSRIVVVHNGIDLAEFPEPAPHVRQDRVRLGFVGFVRDWHGLDTVVDGIAGYEDARRPQDPILCLDVVGDGPALPELRAQVARLRLEQRVTFHGTATREQIPGLVAAFDVALQPKVVAYASPLKLFEYMAAGRAIMGPDQPNIREITRHEVEALLFDPSSRVAMWETVLRLAQDPALRQRLGNAARQRVVQEFTWDRNAARVLATLHERVLADAPPIRASTSQPG